MYKLIERVFRIRRQEFGIVLILGGLLYANSVALQIADIVSTSGFLSEAGVDQILIIWVIDMVMILAAASIQALVVDRFNRVELLRAMSFGFALVYVALGAMFALGVPGVINYSILFILAEQQWFFFPLIFWILANDIFDINQAKRLIPLLASFGFIGEVTGLSISAVAPAVLNRIGVVSYQLLNLVVLIYLVAYLITYGLRNVKIRETRQKQETIRETLTEGWGFVRDVPSFRFLMLSMVAIAIGTTIIEYHFLVVSANAYLDESGSFQTFFSLVTLIRVVAAIGIQSFVASRIITRFGLKNTFFIMPTVTLASLLGNIFIPARLVMGTVANLSTKLTSHTIDQSARKALQALVPEERRGRVSVFIDTYLFAFGVVIGSLIIGGMFVVESALRTQFDIRLGVELYLIIGVVFAILGVWAIFRMRAVYDSSLFNWRLKRRQRMTNVLSKLDF